MFIYNILSVCRSCTKLYIPESIDVLFDTERIKHSEQRLRSAIQRLKEALCHKEQCLTDVLKVVNAAENQLENYTDGLIKTVTELKQKTQDGLDFIRDKLEFDLCEQSSVLNNELTAAKDVLKKTTFANSESKNIS